MRAKKVAINGLWGVIYRVVVILLGFVGRTVFIRYLSTEYLGISGLFSNILTLLSLSELGFSTAISFHLYRLLDCNDQEKITGIMNFYKKAYRVIAMIVLAIGLVILPFLKFIIKDTVFSLEYVSLVYVIYLIKTVSSYMFSYNFTIATAGQNGYILTQIDVVTHIITSFTNILILVLFHNYIIYLVTEIVIGIFGNVIKTMRVRKEYPYITGKQKIDSELKKRLWSDVKNIFAGKVSTVIVTSTDNILISALINVKTVGLYSNYSMLIAYVQNILTQFTSATQASLGDMLNSESKEYGYLVLKRLTVILYFVTSFCAVCLFVLLNPFIKLWIGSEYLLDWVVVALCVLSFYIQIVKTPLWFSIGGIGYFKDDRNIAVCGALTNLVVSVLATYFWGLPGIFFGTVFSQIVQWIQKVNLFMRKYLHRSIREYTILNIKLLLITVLMAGGIGIMFSLLRIDNLYVDFMARICACIIVPNFLNYFVFRKTDEFKYFLSMLKSLFKRRGRTASNLDR